MALKPQMSATYLLLVVIVLVTVSLIIGYGAGHFLTLEEQVTTTATTTDSSTTTLVSTSLSLSTITRTKTETSTTTLSTNMGEQFRTLPPPANSTAVIRGRFLLNGSVFALFSIDKPVYSLGEVVHIKSTITSLSPRNLSLFLDAPVVKVLNSTGEAVWIYPEGLYGPMIGPFPEYRFTLAPGETKTIDQWMTTDWNMIGLNISTTRFLGGSRSRIYYEDHFVPDGQYTLILPASICTFNGRGGEYINEKITFTITK